MGKFHCSGKGMQTAKQPPANILYCFIRVNLFLKVDFVICKFVINDRTKRINLLASLISRTKD